MPPRTVTAEEKELMDIIKTQHPNAVLVLPPNAKTSVVWSNVDTVTPDRDALLAWAGRVDANLKEKEKLEESLLLAAEKRGGDLVSKRGVILAQGSSDSDSSSGTVLDHTNLDCTDLNNTRSVVVELSPSTPECILVVDIKSGKIVGLNG